MSTVTIHSGDSREVLRSLPENSVDAIVTDPPYELGFMGKAWDRSGIANDVKFWDDCLRVLKPGGHLLAFSGSRTYHRMTCAIEDAGFEVRDQMMWVYGSGFPKSLNVGKAMDSLDRVDASMERRQMFTAWVRSTGLTAQQINQATGTCMGSHYVTDKSQPAVMTREHLEAVRHFIGDVPAWVEAQVDLRTLESLNLKNRPIVGKSDNGIAGGTGKHAGESDSYGYSSSYEITAPLTNEAIKWDGWGTALKPSHEPICVARKPLDGTVAENIRKWGVGGLNIQASRMDGKRWPANLMHDGSEEVLGLFPSQAGGGFGVRGGRSSEHLKKMKATYEVVGYGDSGSAARFFYCPKASKRDRDEGLEGFEEKPAFDNPNGNMGGNMGSKSGPRRNIHPTVKPTELMRYLCRLVTPPGGTILDPFLGSGSTGKAAVLEGFSFIGIDLSPEYAAIAKARIDHALKTK
jgi:DNA modification methylase